MPSEGPARSRGAMERRSQNYPSAISTAPVFSFFFEFWAEWPGLDRGVGGRGSYYGPVSIIAWLQNLIKEEDRRAVVAEARGQRAGRSVWGGRPQEKALETLLYN